MLSWAERKHEMGAELRSAWAALPSSDELDWTLDVHRVVMRCGTCMGDVQFCKVVGTPPGSSMYWSR